MARVAKNSVTQISSVRLDFVAGLEEVNHELGLGSSGSSGPSTFVAQR
jgi:hypothetical protein